MINFKTENKGTWFYFNENNHDAGGVCLRELSSDEVDGIERITVRTKKKFKRGVAYDDVSTDKKLAAKLTWRYAIVDWKGVSIDGAIAECNDDNKDKVMKIADFVKFAVDCLEKLSEENKSLEEARVKNLKPSPDGDAVQEG